MSRLFVGNFAWEETLCGDGQLPAAVVRLELERAPCWLGMCSEGDEILLPGGWGEEYTGRMKELGLPEIGVTLPEDLKNSRAEKLVPWGWNAQLSQLASSGFPRTSVPPLESIRQANSREFQFQVCCELGCGLAGEGYFRSVEDLATRLEANGMFSGGETACGPWLLKANLSFAGRGQRRLAGAGLAVEDARWTARAISRTGGVALEPVLQAVRELSGQWEIRPEGEIEFLGFTQLFSDSRGAYLGTSTWLDDIASSFREELLLKQRQVIEIIRQSGYFGPVGIDAMIHTANNGLRLRPVQDINARWTMGRLALGWRDQFTRLGIGKEGTWWHGRTCELPGAICLSPEIVDGIPVSTRNWWIPPNSP